MDNDKTKAKTHIAPHAIHLHEICLFYLVLQLGNLHSAQCNFHREIKHTAFTPLHTLCISHFPAPPSVCVFLVPIPCTISNFKWKKNNLKGFYVDFSRLGQVEMTSHSPLAFTLRMRK